MELVGKIKSFCQISHFVFSDFLVTSVNLQRSPTHLLSTGRDMITLQEVKPRLWPQDMCCACREIDSRSHHEPSGCQTRTSVKYWIYRDLCKIRELKNRGCSRLKTKNSPPIVFSQIGTDLRDRFPRGFPTKPSPQVLPSFWTPPVGGDFTEISGNHSWLRWWQTNITGNSSQHIIELSRASHQLSKTSKIITIE